MTVLGRAFPGFTLSACIVVYVFRGKLIYASVVTFFR
jgi:hypothetical protein